MPSRFRLASQASTMCSRDSPTWLGPGPMRPRTLVAMTTSRRRPATARPRNLLRVAGGVDVRGVEEVDAGVERAADERVRLLLAERADHLPLGAERHRAQAKLRDVHACRGPIAGTSSNHCIGRGPLRAATLDRASSAGAALHAAASSDRSGRPAPTSVRATPCPSAGRPVGSAPVPPLHHPLAGRRAASGRSRPSRSVPRGRAR